MPNMGIVGIGCVSTHMLTCTIRDADNRMVEAELSQRYAYAMGLLPLLADCDWGTFEQQHLSNPYVGSQAG